MADGGIVAAFSRFSERVFMGRYDPRARRRRVQSGRGERWMQHGKVGAEWCDCGRPRPVLCEQCGARVCFTCGGTIEIQSEGYVPCPKFGVGDWWK